MRWWCARERLGEEKRPGVLVFEEDETGQQKYEEGETQKVEGPSRGWGSLRRVSAWSLMGVAP